MRLEDAVVTAVNELKSKGVFSAYDVTTFIRTKSNAGEIDLPGLEARPNNQGIKYWINHDDVKSLVNELYDRGELSNLGLTDRAFNGTYLEYRFDVTNTGPFGTLQGTVTVSTSPVTTGKVTTAPVSLPSSIENKVSAYLNRNASNQPTMKQIQSAIKVNGVTCEKLVTLVEKLGYTVCYDINGPSQSYVD